MNNIIKRCAICVFVLFFGLTFYSVFYVFGDEKDELSFWEETSPNKQAIIDYVSDVTNEQSPNYIPVSDRIAVFDADGTYYCEKGDFIPNYVARFVAEARQKNDPNFTVSEHTAELIRTGYIQQDEQIEILAGLTDDQVMNFVQEFKNQPQPCFNNLTFGEAFYAPMLQLIDYLQQNDFTVFVVSGTDMDIVRAMADGVLDLPASQVTGSIVAEKATAEGNMDDASYCLNPSDYIVRTSRYTKNDNFAKVVRILNTIAQKPVVAVGNSIGDISMMQYVNSNEEHKTFCMMISHDDDEREFAYPTGEKLKDLDDSINRVGCHRVSMKNEFKQIFAKEGVSKKAPSEYIIYQ